VNGVTVLNGDGSPQEDSGSLITRADSASPSDFSNSSESPVVEDRGSVIQYDRPWRGSQTDLDFLDEVQESNNGAPAPIAIEVFEGPLLEVGITASQTSVPVGGTVSFSATVSPPGQSGLTYSWNFDGGAANSTAATPEARFGTAGLYNVTVEVTDAAGGGGGASIPITVGSQPAPVSGNHNQSGGGKSKKSHTPTGPVHSGGTSPGAAAGNSSGTQATGGSGHTAASSTNATGTAGHTSTTTTNGRAGAGRSPAPLKLFPVPNAGPQAPFVSGRLIADVIPLSAAASPLVRSLPGSRGAAPPARQAIRASVLPALAGAFAVVIVFALGAVRELRWRLSLPRLGKLRS
jgi:PKD repeat protein